MIGKDPRLRRSKAGGEAACLPALDGMTWTPPSPSQTSSVQPVHAAAMRQEEALHCIVYVSASLLPMTSAMLERLLVDARRLNAESGVTGVLIYSDGSFMQYFEGEHTAVAETYDRIRRSRLHSRVTELMNESIATGDVPGGGVSL